MPTARGACRRVTLTCSGGFPVAAPQTQVCRLPLRQGPTRRHPLASGEIGVTRALFMTVSGNEEAVLDSISDPCGATAWLRVRVRDDRQAGLRAGPATGGAGLSQRH